MGLAAAMTVQRACSEVTMPALEMEMLCCSMASWMLVLSWSFIYTTHRVPQEASPLIKPSTTESSVPSPETYLVKLINETHATVGQDQGSSL